MPDLTSIKWDNVPPVIEIGSIDDTTFVVTPKVVPSTKTSGFSTILTTAPSVALAKDSYVHVTVAQALAVEVVLIMAFYPSVGAKIRSFIK